MFSTLRELLIAQSVGAAVILLGAAILLARRGLFRWTTTGFWTWAAFALYYLANPLASAQWNLEWYRVYLVLGGGLSRGEWIGFVSMAAMVTFFVSYLRARPPAAARVSRPQALRFTLPMKAVAVVFVAIAVVSLIRYRAGFLPTGNLVIQGGRYTGDVTGYQSAAHLFFFVPVVVLFLSSSRFSRLLGWLLAGVYILLSLLDAWSRFSIVSMLLAISIAIACRTGRKWPSLLQAAVALVFTVVLLLRGHASLTSSAEYLGLLQQAPARLGTVLSSNDSSMLATWYLESYLAERVTGWDYGIPFINYALFGFIPNRFFPQKYMLVDWLHSIQPVVYSPTILNHLLGAKSSLAGSFYSSGGLLAVLVLMWLMGVLCRRLDGMLRADRSLLVRATGISWLSTLWMIWGSSDVWGLTLGGCLALPALAMWLLAPKGRHNHREPVRQEPAGNPVDWPGLQLR